MKNYASYWVVLGVVMGLVSVGQARAPAPQPFTLLVVPEQVNMVQVGFDLVSRRSVALVTYRVSARTGDLVLHGWSGRDWVRIALDDYRDGQFLIRQPDRIILVEGLDDLPMDLVLASGWGPRLMSVAAAEPAEFLNSMGQLFAFTPSEWRWFANRYRLGIEQVGGHEERISWYDQMSAARGQPARRVEEPPPVPVAPLPVPEASAPRPVSPPVAAPVRPPQPEPQPQAHPQHQPPQPQLRPEPTQSPDSVRQQQESELDSRPEREQGRWIRLGPRAALQESRSEEGRADSERIQDPPPVPVAVEDVRPAAPSVPVSPARPPMTTRPVREPVAPIPTAEDLAWPGDMLDQRVDDFRTVK